MTYQVLVQDVFVQYYAYMRHAAHQDAAGRPLWEVMHDRISFEDRWFRQKGIDLLKSIKDNKTVAALSFENREQYLFWLLRWS